jgi:hypothetical protein
VATLRTPPQQTSLVDHQLITHADAADLPREYGSATMTQFLVPVLQLPHGEPAAALGPRTRMLGEQLAPLLPQLAELQRDGVTRSPWCSGLGNVGALTSSEAPCVWLPSRARARRNTKLPSVWLDWNHSRRAPAPVNECDRFCSF